MQAVCSVLSPSTMSQGIVDLTTNAWVSPGVSATDYCFPAVGGPREQDFLGVALSLMLKAFSLTEI